MEKKSGGLSLSLYASMAMTADGSDPTKQGRVFRFHKKQMKKVFRFRQHLAEEAFGVVSYVSDTSSIILIVISRCSRIFYQDVHIYYFIKYFLFLKYFWQFSYLSMFLFYFLLDFYRNLFIGQFST
jgi:hypothetical protein